MEQLSHSRLASALIRVVAGVAMLGFAGFGLAAGEAAAADENDAWPGLSKDIFHGAELKDGAQFLALDVPTRAEDAATVPVSVSVNLPAQDQRRLVALTLVIDQNPSPLAGTFKLGPNTTLTSLSTRVRVNSYTNVHAVAELSDGGLYEVERFVKASGGCSAPMGKDPQEAKAAMGQIKLRQFAKEGDAAAGAQPRERDVQVMLRHPNNSGMQMDQVTRLYIPPLFVDELKLWQGDDLIFSLEGGISISEDPNFRVTYRNPSSSDFRVEIVDTDKHLYKGEFPVRKPQT